mmetsp:Transcript_35673/g.43006  ORF Transcript_35673/g.43006 Transcript_35673/m.43006 type:complete len:180 (-) Transcript_35673:387-926(-)|eukprot:CAMPEP_0197847546 /NCGR_PEP_ID=MMETSP1438-20131217/6376_1 /TAXON_ID=1461541 /ORGANISM="Pterosperma sp., Strain CCMP1384" /LENGTH=179 /DNA_ID=CAMNT_0043459497 /DNA_START=226 /DNA_END=765 /DNA_ORIENTATION=+
MVKKKQLGGGSKYSKREVLELKAVFEGHDKDGSGEVTISEIVESMKGTNLADQGENMFKALDKDKNGKIDFKEYLKSYYPLASAAEAKQMYDWAYPVVERPKTPEKKMSPEMIEEIKSIFVLYDQNGDGVLSRPELVEALTQTGYDEDEVEDMFEAYDADGSNSVSFEEFCQMLESSYI